jgi:hypothetical protein
MNLGWWMLAGSAVSAFGITAFLGKAAPLDVRLAVWLGMLAPLAGALFSASMIGRVYRTRPQSLMGAMSVAFFAKLVFFGVYVAVVIKSGLVRPAPFAISFTGYFLALHITEAFRLRSLFAVDRNK